MSTTPKGTTHRQIQYFLMTSVARAIEQHGRNEKTTGYRLFELRHRLCAVSSKARLANALSKDFVATRRSETRRGRAIAGCSDAKPSSARMPARSWRMDLRCKRAKHWPFFGSKKAYVSTNQRVWLVKRCQIYLCRYPILVIAICLC